MRIGKPDQTVIWQGAKPHGQMHLGNGTDTFAKSGCVVTSVVMALRLLGARVGVTPIIVNEIGRRAGAFANNSSACNVRALIDAQKSIISGQDFPGPGQHSGVDRLLPIIESTIKSGGVCLVHVDHDSLAGGDAIGDHWICAYAIEDGLLICADPATAKNELLDLKTLSGAVVWRDKKKNYKVKRVVTVHLF